MEQTYDILIIGSGMGGLASAVILAKEGYRVCVLEKNNQYGGNLQTFSRDKTIFDTGVHYLGSLAKGQNLHQYFKYLEIIDNLKLEQMDDCFDRITFEDDNSEYAYAQGYSHFIEELSKSFPEEKENIATYIQRIQEICSSFALYNLEDTEENYLVEYLSISVKDFLDEITDNEKLKCVLAGTNLLYAGDGEKTPIYVHALSVNSYIQSAWRIALGGSQITKALVKQLRKYKGEIFKRKEVVQVHYQEGIPCEVLTKTGEIYKAKKFISNMDLNATISIFGKENFRKSFTKRIADLEVSSSSFSVYIKFKPNSFPYLNYNIYHFKNQEAVWEAAQNQSDDWPQMYMLSMGINHKSKEFADNLSVLTYMSFEKVKQWENTVNTIVEENERGKAYNDFKKEHIEKVLSELEKKYPLIRESIQSVYASTPLSYRDYIGSKKGNMYGFSKDASSPLKTQVYAKTKFPNLFLTGQSVNLHGILGTTIGAVNTCGEILGKSYLISKIKEELNE